MPSLSSFALAFLTRSDCLLAYSGLRFPSSTFHGYLHVMWIVLREDLAMIRRPATSAHAFIRKSRLDSPGAIHVVVSRLGQEATATVIRSSAACSWSRTGGANWTAVRAPIEPFHCRRDQ